MPASPRVLISLVKMQIRTRLEYRSALILDWLALMFAYASAYTAIALIVLRFDEIGGWTWAEMALLLSVHLLSYSVGAAFSFVQFRVLEDVVRLGTFDTLMVKPISPWVYIAFSGFNIGYTGHVVLALALLAWSASEVSIAWSPGFVFYFVAALVSAAMITAAFVTMIGASALVWVRSRHLYTIFFGFWELARYPLNIFPAAIQALLIAVIPLAFIAYVPVAVLLGKPVPILGDWAGPASLAAGPIATLLAMLYWRWCVRNYQGAGG